MQAAGCEGSEQCHRRGQQEPDSVADEDATFCSGRDFFATLPEMFDFFIVCLLPRKKKGGGSE